MGNAKLQSVYVKAETTFGDATGDFSAGLRVYPVGDMVDLTNLTQNMTDPGYVTGAFSENMPESENTIKTGTFTTNLYLPGATLSGDDVDADNFTTWMDIVAGAVEGAAASDACDAGCTTTSIVVAGAATFAAGDLIMINGEVRMVDTWTGGTTTLTVTVPFSAAPSAADKIYNMEQWDISNASDSAGWGFEHQGASNYDVICKGCIPAKITVSGINTNDSVQVGVEWIVQDFSKAAGIVTDAATAEVENSPVSCAAGGDVATTDSVSALLSMCGYNAEFEMGSENMPVKCFTSTNGIGGYAKTPVDGLGTLTLQVYEDGTPIREKLTGIVGSTKEMNIQIGSVRGKVVGIYIPDCHLKEKEPDFKPNDGLFYIESMWRCSPNMIIYRG